MPDTDLLTVAQMMCEYDCGELPVVKDTDEMKPVGVITDRDITCRSIAKGKNPLEMTAADCMSKPCITVTPEMSLEDCCEVLEYHQIRRAPVVDEWGNVCGIISKADIARYGSREQTAELVQLVSEWLR